MTTRSIYLGPTQFLPRRGFVVVPVLPPHRLPDGTQARSAVVGLVDGRWVAYANVCRHLAIPLDMGDGDVMDPDRHTLVCHHHGAVFEGASGECTVGPCYREFLWRWEIVVENGEASLVVGGEAAATPAGDDAGA